VRKREREREKEKQRMKTTIILTGSVSGFYCRIRIEKKEEKNEPEKKLVAVIWDQTN